MNAFNNFVRFASLTLYVVLAVPVVFIGLAAFSDFEDRGCFGGGAMQCSDALAVMAIALAYLSAGPVLWLVSKLFRRVALVRKGAHNA